MHGSHTQSKKLPSVVRQLDQDDADMIDVADLEAPVLDTLNQAYPNWRKDGVNFSGLTQFAKDLNEWTQYLEAKERHKLDPSFPKPAPFDNVKKQKLKDRVPEIKSMIEQINQTQEDIKALKQNPGKTLQVLEEHQKTRTARYEKDPASGDYGIRITGIREFVDTALGKKLKDAVSQMYGRFDLGAVLAIFITWIKSKVKHIDSALKSEMNEFKDLHPGLKLTVEEDINGQLWFKSSLFKNIDDDYKSKIMDPFQLQLKNSDNKRIRDFKIDYQGSHKPAVKFGKPEAQSGENFIELTGPTPGD